ncbi:MAG: DUF393 domain-containing protein [Phycisphaerales bacterium]|nr:MAG: DUF393 domain-containing protein [Phycisphaerales bacterium]
MRANLRDWLRQGRVAHPAPAGWNVAKTIVQIVLMWSTFLAILPAGVYWLEGRAGWSSWRFAADGWRTAGAVLFVLASAGGFYTGMLVTLLGDGTPLPLDSPRRLVIRGPYRYIRNPMAIFGLAQGFAVGLYLGSPSVLVYAFLGVLAWNYLARPWEEADLERRFGESYRRYRRRVRCWRPRLRPYDPAAEAAEPPISDEHTTPPGRWLVLFDGHCSFCRARADTIARMAALPPESLMSVHAPAALSSLPGVSFDACMTALHVVTPAGRVASGPEAIALVLRRHAFWGAVARLYYIPGVRLLCDAGYSLLARNRYAFGRCEDGACDRRAE